jgi:ABC-type multidrug transport system ATPase subunit
MSAAVVSLDGRVPALGSGVRVDGLTKSYGRLPALTDVSFSVRPGEVLGLIGPNGAGKTTLFECLAGVLPHEAGRITVDGEPMSARARAAHIFYVPDAIAPWPAQTVRWALEFTIGLFGGSRDRRDEVIERFDLAALLESPIGTLSKGQRKRAVLAAGLLTPQPLLLTDEPFDGLDLRQTREVGAALREYAGRGRTLFLSIHQISDAARFCDRFVLLSSGRVCGEGALEELTEAARTRPMGGSNPNLNPRNPLIPPTLEDVFLALT